MTLQVILSLLRNPPQEGYAGVSDSTSHFYTTLRLTNIHTPPLGVHSAPVCHECSSDSTPPVPR
eukprot:7080921-Pyramimonas_sp.AAC.1